MTTAFAVFCALCAGIPLFAWNFVRNSEVEQKVNLEVGAGTVSVTRPGRILAEVIEDRLDNVPEAAEIRTDRDSQAILAFGDPQNDAPLGSVQIYGGTVISLTRIRSPRFEYSQKAHHILLQLDGGRARVSLADGGGRPVVITLQTPQGTVVFEQAGSYSVEVTEQETQVTVRDGQAVARARGSQTVVNANQRTVIPAGSQPLGALPPERNLLNGDLFGQDIGAAWGITERQREPGDDQGYIEVTDSLGRPAAHFVRQGLDWGLLELRHVLNRDVRDLRELRIHLAVLIQRQDLARCGTMGSECPVMVKVEFLDTSDTPREWLQGFYGDSPSTADAPGACVTCPPPTGPHIRLQPGIWYVYDSPNLIEAMTAQGLTPASVRAVTIYASGHTFESQVSEVELLALE